MVAGGCLRCAVQGVCVNRFESVFVRHGPNVEIRACGVHPFNPLQEF